MKKNIFMIGALALAVAASNAQAVEVLVKDGGSVLQLTPKLAKKGKNFTADWYANTTLTLGSDWAVSPEIAGELSFVADGKSKADLSLAFVRFTAVGPALKKWSDKRKFSIDYRYVAPLDRGSQLAGNLGVIGVRPVLNWAFTDRLGLLVRGMTQVALVRNNYQIHKPSLEIPKDYKGPKGNTFVSFSPEVQLSYDIIADKLGVSTYWVPAFALKGADKGKDNTTWAKVLSHQHAISYAFNKALALEVGITNEKIALDKKFSLFKADRNAYYAELTYKY